MIWLITYLCSLLFIGITAGLIATSGRDRLSMERADVLAFVGIALIWPLVLIAVIPLCLLGEKTNEGLKEACRHIMNKYEITSDTNDRSSIVEVPEKDLKILLKAYRKKLIELEPEQVQIIRDELLHRLTERSLLK